jgi:glycosyltransferase involved in cell wall biosynthesis
MTYISVIVPAYNEAKLLPRSLGSLRHSVLRLADETPETGTELIVVDNGSRDATALVTAEYGATVVSEARRNVSSARNAGAKSALGDLLAFVDADYRVPMEFLPRVVTHFRADLTLTAAGTKVAVEPTEIDPITRGCAAVSLALLRHIMTMSFGIFIVRRAYFDELGGFDQSLYAYEDVEFLRRMKQRERAGHGRYQILDGLTAYTSARGFYRRGMIRTYTRMAISKSAWRDPAKCGYWYAR